MTHSTPREPAQPTRVIVAEGVGVLVDTERQHGHTRYQIVGSGFSGWYPAAEVQVLSDAHLALDGYDPQPPQSDAEMLMPEEDLTQDLLDPTMDPAAGVPVQPGQTTPGNVMDPTMMLADFDPETGKGADPSDVPEAEMPDEEPTDKGKGSREGSYFDLDTHDDRDYETDAGLPEFVARSEDDDEVAEAVARYNASTALHTASTVLSARTAGRVYSPSEEQALIDEGADGVRASQFGNLDLAGTHYVVAEEDEDDLLWP